MKRIIFSFVLSCTLIVNAFAAGIEPLNAFFTDIFAPYQNEKTQIDAMFTAAETNADHAVKIVVNAKSSKIGSRNRAFVTLDNLSYDYDDGVAPKVVFKGTFSFDFTRLLSQSQINAFFDGAGPILEKELKKYFLDAYGDAASSKLVVTSTTKDKNKNYINLAGLLSVKMDLSKLFDESDRESVFLTEVLLSFKINTKKGVSIDGFIVSNPDYRAYKKDEFGLKDFLDALEEGNTSTITTVTHFVKQYDEFFELLVSANRYFDFIPISTNQ